MGPKTLAAEALLATIGVGRLLALKPRAITPAEGAKAQELPRHIERALKAFLTKPRFEADDLDRSAFDFKTVAESINRAEDVDRAAALLANLVDDELGSEVISVGLACANYLRTILPGRGVEDVLFGEAMPPSDAEVSTFRRAWLVCDDFLSIFADMRAGILTPDQRIAFQTCFPALYGATQQVVVNVLIDLRAANDKYTLPYAKRLSIETLLGQAMMSPAFLAEMQAGARREQQKEPSPSSLDIDVDAGQTPNQRVSAR